MQRFRSPRRFAVALGSALLAAGVMGLVAYALMAGTAGTILLAGPVCATFLLIVAVRAVRSRVELDATGGRYVGFVRTRSWRWTQARAVGRQSTFAVGSTGSTPEVALRDGTAIVLVALSDPRHPAAEDALIARCRELMTAAYGALAGEG